MPELDGLLALAILNVLIGHFGIFGSGGDGATLFFFISGFIITRGLMNLLRANGTVAVGNFYLRRFLRLAPALTFMIVVSMVMLYVTQGRLPWADALVSFLYLSNYAEIYFGLVRESTWFSNPFPSLWSLAVEEHYYLFFPLFLLAFGRRTKLFIAAMCALALAVLVWRTVILATGVSMPEAEAGLASIANRTRLYKATDARIDSILYGAILATMLQADMPRILRVLFHSTTFIAALMMLGAEFLLLRRFYGEEVIRPAIQGICLMPILAQLVVARRPSMMASLLRHSTTVWIGKLSYSIYLFNWPMMVLATGVATPYTPEWILWGLLGTAGFALLSYYGVEQPVLRLRNRHRSTGMTLPSGAPA